MSDEHSCPRRVEAPYRLPGDDGVDRWENRGGFGGHKPVGRVCSYCGSLNPDRFMELVEQGWVVGPTDKSYKAYLHKPLSDGEMAELKQRWLHDSRAVDVLDAIDGDPEAAHALEQQWRQTPGADGSGPMVAKFYYQHLSSAQMDRFVELINQKRMRIGYPGRFYVLPFFTTRRP